MKDTIAQLASKYNIKPSKQLRQNFILEIGPGIGGLTQAILQSDPKKLLVIEKDKRLISLLEEIQSNYCNMQIFISDALKFSVESYAVENKENINIVANLPYNVATPFLIKWLYEINHIDSITIMLQKEAVNRIISKVNSEFYGRLSIICQLLCDVEKLMDVKNCAFYPMPKVDSAVIKLTPKKDLKTLRLLPILEKITHKAFSQRRKMIGCWIKKIIPNNYIDYFLSENNLDLKLRAENLSIDDYKNIAEFIFNLSS